VTTVTASEIAALFSDTIKVDDIAPDDNFFEVGGNSMLALQMMAKLEAESGVTISLLDVVRAATPRELASLIEQRTTASPR
jgi:acyl carrier protein